MHRLLENVIIRFRPTGESGKRLGRDPRGLKCAVDELLCGGHELGGQAAGAVLREDRLVGQQGGACAPAFAAEY